MRPIVISVKNCFKASKIGSCCINPTACKSEKDIGKNRASHNIFFNEDNIIQNPIFSNDGQPFSPKIEIIMGSHNIYSVIDKIGNEELKDPYMFNIISPEPDMFAQGKFFTFTDSAKLNHIFNHGIVVTAEEISQVDLSQKRMILFNVLIGTILAFCLEIIVQLVIKWRNLAIRKERME